MDAPRVSGRPVDPDDQDRSIHSTKRRGSLSVTIITRVTRVFSCMSCFEPARAFSTVSYRADTRGELVEPPLTVAMSLKASDIVRHQTTGWTPAPVQWAVADRC